MDAPPAAARETGAEQQEQEAPPVDVAEDPIGALRWAVGNTHGQGDARVPHVLSAVEASGALEPGALGRGDLGLFWYLRSRYLSGEESILAVRCLRNVERLCGPNSAMTLVAYDDAAMTLERHGYLGAAEDLLRVALRGLPLLDADPNARARERARLLTRLLSIDAGNLLVAPRPGDTDTVYAHAAAVERLIDAYPDPSAAGGYRFVACRRLLQIECALALRERGREGYRKGLVLPRRFWRYQEQGERASSSTPSVGWSLSWSLACAAIALERNDAEDFARNAARFLDRRAGPHQQHRHLDARYARLVGQAASRTGKAWRRQTLRAPQSTDGVLTYRFGAPDDVVRRGRPEFLA